MPEPSPIDRAIFREAADGTTVFFPWGFTHRGYRLPDAAARKKATRGVSTLVGATIAIGTWTAHRLQALIESGAAGRSEILAALAAPGAALFVVVLCYWLWASRFVEGMRESDLRVSREERLREAAELAKPRKLALIGLAFAGLSGLLIWLQPSAWWLGLAGVGLGLGTLYWSRLLQRAKAQEKVD